MKIDIIAERVGALSKFDYSHHRKKGTGDPRPFALSLGTYRHPVTKKTQEGILNLNYMTDEQIKFIFSHPEILEKKNLQA